MKLQKQSKSQYTITVPIAFVKAKQWNTHEHLRWLINDNGDLVLKKKKD